MPSMERHTVLAAWAATSATVIAIGGLLLAFGQKSAKSGWTHTWVVVGVVAIALGSVVLLAAIAVFVTDWQRERRSARKIAACQAQSAAEWEHAAEVQAASQHSLSVPPVPPPRTTRLQVPTPEGVGHVLIAKPSLLSVPNVDWPDYQQWTVTQPNIESLVLVCLVAGNVLCDELSASPRYATADQWSRCWAWSRAVMRFMTLLPDRTLEVVVTLGVGEDWWDTEIHPQKRELSATLLDVVDRSCGLLERFLTDLGVAPGSMPQDRP